MRGRPAIAIALVLLLTRSTGQAGLPESDAYVWQRRWSPALADAVATNAGLFRTWHVLAAEVEANDGLTLTQADWAALASAGHAVVPVVRIEGRIDAARTPGLIVALQAIMAALPASLQGKIEIDHDSATARLRDYTRFLRAVRAAVPLATLAATALPTWLSSPDFADFAQAVDLLILQVHSIDDPRLGVFDPVRAARWVDALPRQTRRPFLIALPAYGARVAVAPTGRLLAISAEMHAMDGMAGMEIAAAPLVVAGFLDRLQRNPPDGLRGLVWFRLPTAADRRAWRAATLRAVVLGEPLHPIVEIVTRPGWTAGLLDILVANNGETDGAIPDSVVLPAGCGAADGVGQYRREGDALTLQGGGGLLAPHAAVRAGWMRCGEDGPRHDAPK